jgi:ABC-2 type transport system ATP-binding protein
MTGREFLSYMAGLKGITPRLVKKRADEVTELLGIERHYTKKITDWSAGLRQRLGLAQALLNDPAILILDEPFCGLDPEENDRVVRLLTRLSHDKAILISSHIMERLTITGLLLLVDGKVQFAGAPALFLDEARDKVWLCETTKDEWLRWRQKYTSGSVVFDGNQCRCKIISDDRPDIPGAKAVIPGLEEAYLFWLRRSIRADREGEIC